MLLLLRLLDAKRIGLLSKAGLLRNTGKLLGEERIAAGLRGSEPLQSLTSTEQQLV
jgi:hypothetical protein